MATITGMGTEARPFTCCVLLDRGQTLSMEHIQKTIERHSRVAIRNPDMGRTHECDVFMFRCTRAESGELKRWFDGVLRSGWSRSPESVLVGDVRIYDVRPYV